MTNRGAVPLPPCSWWTGVRVLRLRDPRILVGANALTSFGGGMQLLLQGWLVIAWGHSPWLLALFAACRIVPKIVLTFPAGILTDRVPRARVLLASRGVNTLCSLLPLAGFVSPHPLAWVFAAAILAGMIHGFDLPSGRAMIADVVEPADLDATVALSGAGSHLSGLIGPAAAFLLAAGPGRPVALLASAAMLAAASALTAMLPVVQPTPTAARGTAAALELVRYLAATPIVAALLLAETLPSVVSKVVVLLLPSLVHGGGTTSLAMIATEVGALLAAGVLALAPVRLGYRGLCAAAAAYTLLIVLASTVSHEGEVLVALLGCAGMAKLALTTGALARVQEIVPTHLRGRVLAV